MRTYLLILVLALLKVSMARPNDAFTIDMYQGNRHLRYERSDDQPTIESANAVEVHNVDADQAMHQTETHQTESLKDSSLTVEQSLKMAEDVINQWDAKTSEGQQTEVHKVHEQQAAKDAAEPVAAKKESSTVKETVKEEIVKDKAVAKDSPVAKSESTSKIEVTSGSSRPKEETAVLSKPSYLFKYGEVLNLINHDKVSPLSSKSRSKSAKSKKLSKGGAPPSQSSGGSVSYMVVNGKEYSGSSPSNVIVTKPTGGLDAPGFGAPRAFGAPGPVAFGPAFGPMYGAVHDQTRNLKSNIKMGLHGFTGHNHRGVQMLNFHRQPASFQPAPHARFRPF